MCCFYRLKVNIKDILLWLCLTSFLQLPGKLRKSEFVIRFSPQRLPTPLARTFWKMMGTNKILEKEMARQIIWKICISYFNWLSLSLEIFPGYWWQMEMKFELLWKECPLSVVLTSDQFLFFILTRPEIRFGMTGNLLFNDVLRKMMKMILKVSASERWMVWGPKKRTKETGDG